MKSRRKVDQSLLAPAEELSCDPCGHQILISSQPLLRSSIIADMTWITPEPSGMQWRIEDGLYNNFVNINLIKASIFQFDLLLQHGNWDLVKRIYTNLLFCIIDIYYSLSTFECSSQCNCANKVHTILHCCQNVNAVVWMWASMF